jgi:NADH dehydrogenase/NADH:ubiquinone oxidoreductase subunit G
MKDKDMIHLQINGRAYRGAEGETILAVARREGIPIPTLCHHEGLEPYGGCRICMVEITHRNWKGWKGQVAACLYPVEEGLEVVTDNESVHAVRRVVLDLLLARCPGAEAIRKLAAEYGLHETSYLENKEKTNCILCTQCVRACAALGASAISTGDRGAQKKIAIPFRKPPPDCIGCLSCVHVCPTDVIKYEDQGDTRRIWGRTFKMVKCADCKRPFMTEAQRDFEALKTGLPKDAYSACPDCRKRSTVERIGETF